MIHIDKSNSDEVFEPAHISQSKEINKNETYTSEKKTKKKDSKKVC